MDTLRARSGLTLQIAAFVCVSAFVAVHLTFTLLFSLPPTPLTVRYQPQILRYMYPYFAQNWSFFAPNPPVDDDFVIVQYEMKMADGKLAYSPWINLSRTFNEVVQHNRLSALEVVQLAISNAYGDATRSEIFRDSHLVPNANEILRDPMRKPPSIHTIERAAMSYFPRSGVPGTLVAERIGFLHHKFPRYNHRDEADDVTKNNTVLYLPSVRAEQVAPL